MYSDSDSEDLSLEMLEELAVLYPSSSNNNNNKKMKKNNTNCMFTSVSMPSLKFNNKTGNKRGYSTGADDINTDIEVLVKVIRENTLEEASSSISSVNSSLPAVDSSVVKIDIDTLCTATGGTEINVGYVVSHVDKATATKDKESSRRISISYKITSVAAITVMTGKKD